MSKNTKIVVSAIVVILLIFIVWAVRNNAGSSSKQVIKIGVVAPLTGGGAVYGNAFVKSADLALADLKDTKYQYQLIVEDDATKAAQSASAAQKLISVDGVKALITTTSGTGNAIKSIATAAQIPQISAATDLAIGDGLYNFTNLPYPQSDAAVWIKKAQSENIKTVAIISQNHPGINALIDALKPALASSTIKLVFEDRYDPSTTDFKTIIAKARQTNPDIYLVSAYPPTMDIVGQQMREQGIKNISGMATFPAANDPSLFEGDWYTDATLATPSFVDRFEKAYPGTRFNARTGPQGYDALTLIVKAFESGQDPAVYLQNLREYDGILGHVTKAPGSGVLSSPAALWVIKNGKGVEIQ